MRAMIKGSFKDFFIIIDFLFQGIRLRVNHKILSTK
ncbi:hypothetical protein HNQ88_004374 [Aureibacter tunicatorum]|uniref:Uncharacterized protein n=1 Tax=Aureibacter tunicatorum TaxID=866807 RepID=A0AAE3XNR1_9BACT|nr:hypothetical protein [Aureibacter tunicatorum]BDD03556.1 hypothetical protein AUTU_10390 [Aureibacter tunicatorum]